MINNENSELRTGKTPYADGQLEPAFSCVSLDLYCCHINLMDGFPMVERKKKKKRKLASCWVLGGSSLCLSVADKLELTTGFHACHFPARANGPSRDLSEGPQHLQNATALSGKGDCSVPVDLCRSLGYLCFYDSANMTGGVNCCYSILIA